LLRGPEAVSGATVQQRRGCRIQKIEEQGIVALSGAFKALGNPVRLRALRQTERGVKVSATKLRAVMPDVKLENLSYHLRRLADAGYIRRAERVPHRGAFEQLYLITPKGVRASDSFEEVAKLLGA
jgi:DNA-binding transcriptional ArsR family regulator